MPVFIHLLLFFPQVCSFAFTTSRALKMHTRLHTGEKPYKCDVCDRAFTRRDEMHTHMYIHKGMEHMKSKHSIVLILLSLRTIGNSSHALKQTKYKNNRIRTLE